MLLCCITLSSSRENQRSAQEVALFYVDTRIFLKAIRGNGYRFVPKGGMFPTETITIVLRSSYL